jgi:hypothetical protein
LTLRLVPGDVIRLWDRFTRPAKEKRHLCVCPEKRLFLGINSRPTFPPHLLLRVEETSFLDHDSYLQLQQLARHYQAEIDAADYLGRVTGTLAQRDCLAVEASVGLTTEQKEFVRARLGY